MQVGKPKVVYLEPVVLAEIAVPDLFKSAITNDLRKRGASIESVSPTIKAFAPLSRMLGCVERFRKITGGSGNFAIDFARYEETTFPTPPREIEDTE